MPTLRPLDPETKEFLEDLVRGTYLDGACYELACALYRGLQWKLIGLIQEMDGEIVVRHAAVRHPDGGFFDARGHVTEEEFLSPFGPGEIRDFALQDDLRKLTRPIQEHAISMAGKLAMSLWPELPWTKHTYVNSLVAFVGDLEKLCRRHGFWLYAPVPNPASWPQISVEDGGESGYEILPTGNGVYAINRCFKSQE